MSQQHAVSYEIKSESLNALLLQISGPQMRGRVSNALRRSLLLLENWHKDNELLKGRGTSPPVADKVTFRTGELSKSYRIFMAAGALSGAYGTELRRARVLEKGETITAKGGALAIPTRRLRVGVGMDPRWPRDWPPGELFRPKGHRYLARRNEAGGIEIMYVLVRSVKIGARPGLARTVDKKMGDVLHILAEAFAGREADGAARG